MTHYVKPNHQKSGHNGTYTVKKIFKKFERQEFKAMEQQSEGFPCGNTC